MRFARESDERWRPVVTGVSCDRHDSVHAPMRRSIDNPLLRPVRWAAVALTAMLAAAATAQEPGQPPADPLTVKAVEAKIAEISADQTLDEGVKTRALEAYNEAVAKLKIAEAQAAAAQGNRDLLADGPGSLSSFRAELKAPAPEITPSPEEISRRPIQEVEIELTRDQGRLAEQQRTADLLAAKVAEEQRRPAMVREYLAAANERLQQIDAEFKALDEPNEILREARTTRVKARRLARTNEIDALEQEQLVHQVRLDLYTAQRDLALRTLGQLEQRVKDLTALLADKRREEVERAQREAELAKLAARGKHPVLVELAEQNADFGAELTSVTEKIDEASGTHAAIAADLKRVEDEHRSAQTKLERVGLSDVLGDIFLEQRKKLPDLRSYERASKQYRDQIGAVRLGSFRVDEKRVALSDPGGWLDKAIEHADPPIAADDVADFRTEANILLAHQVDLLEKLDAAYGRYLNVLGNLDFDQRRLVEEVQEYQGFLDDHLLWTRSALSLGPVLLRSLIPATAWLVSPANWNATAIAAVRGVRDNKLLTLIGLAALVLLFWSRRWSISQLEKIATRVKRRHSDNYSLTVSAFALTGVLAAPVPVLFGGLGWLLAGTTAAQTFPHAVGIALAHVAGSMFLLLSFRALLGEHGVARAHFAWRDNVVQIFRRAMPWLICLGLPALFISELASAQANETYQNSLGRLAFIAGMIVLTVVVARVFAPGRGALEHTMHLYPHSWLSRLRRVWYPLVVMTPLAVAAVAGVGYYYTALVLDRRLRATALTLAASVLIYNLIVRWLVVARTRLAIARAREKRAAARQAAEADGASEPEPVDLDIPEIDLATVKEQSLRLFKTAVVLVTLVSLFGIWADVLPALGVFDRELWQSHVTIGGEEQLRSITIASVLLALLTAAVCFVGAANLPGFLEVTFLKGLDPGTRYAVATMGQYILGAIGIVVALQALGVAWSHVQWLVAALGVGLGFGLQEIFANFVSGVIILVERPVRVGDTVTIGEISGTVTRIRIRATTITDWDQKELVVPNKSFITGKLVNWSLSNPVTRMIIKVGIAYGSNTELALRLMMNAAREHPKVLEDPEPSVFFVGFGDSSLDFEVRVFIRDLSNRARTTIVHDLHLAIDRAFREHDVVIAFPQRDVHIKAEEQPPISAARRE